MFKQKRLKDKREGGEGKMRKNIIPIVLLAILLAFTQNYYCFAGVTTRNIQVTATVPVMADGLDVGISSVVNTGGDCNAGNDAWTGGQGSINFGTLTWDTANKIFTPANYFAVDVGVIDNSGDWGIQHTRTDFKHASEADTLNQNVNAVFVRKMFTRPGDPSVEDELGKFSYGDSNNKSFRKTALQKDGTQGWLRVYYGISTGDPRREGDCKGDATGVTPLGLDKRSGTYNGIVTLTLTP